MDVKGKNAKVAACGHEEMVSAVDLTLRSSKEECPCPRIFQLAALIAKGVKGMVDYLAGNKCLNQSFFQFLSELEVKCCYLHKSSRTEH